MSKIPRERYHGNFAILIRARLKSNRDVLGFEDWSLIDAVAALFGGLFATLQMIRQLPQGAARNGVKHFLFINNIIETAGKFSGRDRTSRTTTPSIAPGTSQTAPLIATLTALSSKRNPCRSRRIFARSRASTGASLHHETRGAWVIVRTSRSSSKRITSVRESSVRGS